ncbi:hypothetical protein GQ55_5G501800 [Panicum hallii var. hallii]|uniref:Uncharacterized protein n=1 Tax=Panicum hallii var. hallii TaxID=1504633 RepID=A0A2T7DRY7_9POAL|nr:hypothetical protein GQ55_5G501800 [Panicum hallii var. hallii]
MHRRDRESEDSLVTAGELLTDERPEVPLRRAALRRRGARLLPPHGGLGAHHLGRGEAEAPPQLAGLQHAVLVADGGPDPGAEPLHQPRVGALVRPLGHPHGRHAARHALQRRVPAAVRDEAPHGRVRQHPHLVAPLHHHAALAAERRGVAGALAHAVVLPQHPQERPPALRHAARHLLDLPLAHHRQATERDVHHRAGRLRVQPLEVALAVLPEQVVAAVLGDGPGRRRLIEEGEHGADGDDVDAVLAQRRHRLRLHGVEGVGEHAGAVVAAEHVDELAEHVGHERVRVVLGGVGDERRQVADAERREARDADGGHGVAARRGDGPVDAVGAAEEVEVGGEHGGRLDPVERDGHAVATGHVSDPRQEQRVDDESDGPPRGTEAFEDGPERAGADDLDLAHVVRGVVHVTVEAGVVAVGVGHVPHPRGVAVALAGRRRPLLVAREHLAERGHGGGDGDPRPRGAQQAAREVARRVDVALRRVGHHQEVRLGRPRRRLRRDLLHHGRHCARRRCESRNHHGAHDKADA